ncbi:MAG: hypothetical protein RIB58_04050 [Phycisphaerales bacterium]
MPPRYPKADSRFLAWARIVTRVWTGWQPGGGSTGVPDIGLSDEQASRAADLFEAAYQAHLRQREAMVRARSATRAKRLAFAEFKKALGADIATITAYASSTGDPGVYVRARLDARKTGSRRTPRGPVAPRDPRLRFDVNASEMVLTWGGRTRPGTVYSIRRRLVSAAGPAGPAGAGAPHGAGPNRSWAFIAAVSERRFVDTTIPPGTAEVTYLVSATKNGRTVQGFTATARLHGGQWCAAAPLSARASRSA